MVSSTKNIKCHFWISYAVFCSERSKFRIRYQDLMKNMGYSYDFSTAYRPCIDAFSMPYDKPSVLTQTGAIDGNSGRIVTATCTNRKAWLKMLSNYDGFRYPTSAGSSWFQCLKGSDFRVVMSTSDAETYILKS